MLIDDVNTALAERNTRVALEPEALEWLIDQAQLESNSGARPLRRAIQRNIEDELSELMIQNLGSVPVSVTFRLEDDRLVPIPELSSTLDEEEAASSAKS